MKFTHKLYTKYCILFTAAIFLTFFLYGARLSLASSFTGDHCVSWETQVTSFLFLDSNVRGESCEVSVEIEENEEGAYVIRAEVPIKSFESGDRGRNNEVFEYLKGKWQPNILIESIAVSKRDLKLAILGRQKFLVSMITVANKTFPLELSITNKLEGMVQTSFTALGLDPPQKLWGVIASSKNSLLLKFKFSLKKIENLDLLK